MTFHKLPAKSLHIVLPLIISVLMSCIVSGVSTARGIGLNEDFFHTWMASWGISWVIAFPILLIVLPTARRIAFLFVEKY